MINLSGNLISENKSHIQSFKSLSPSFKISNNKLNLFSSKQIISSFFFGSSFFSFLFLFSYSFIKFITLFSSVKYIIVFSISPL